MRYVSLRGFQLQPRECCRSHMHGVGSGSSLRTARWCTTAPGRIPAMTIQGQRTLALLTQTVRINPCTCAVGGKYIVDRGDGRD